MSNLIATIKQIQTNQNLTLLTLECFNTKLSMLSLELNQNIKIDSKVKLLIKPTNISICKKNTTDISIENKILCKISSIQKGELLCSVLLKFYDTTLESIITLNSLEQLDLKVDDEVIALVNSSDISILELLDV